MEKYGERVLYKNTLKTTITCGICNTCDEFHKKVYQLNEDGVKGDKLCPPCMKNYINVI